MALLSNAIKDKEFDVRMIARGLAKGLILQDEVEKNQKKIADDATNCDYVNIDALFQSIGSGGRASLRA